MFEAYAQTPDAATAPAIPAEAEPDTLSEAVQADPQLVLDKIERWVEGFQRLIPNILVALVVLLIFVGIGWGVQKGVRSWGRRRDRENLGAVLGSFVKWVVIILGLLVGLIIVIPTFRPGDLIAGLGIGSIAIGFAFRDILQNWLAGLLLLIRRPFRIGDEIVVNGYEGKVEWIETRATMIRTYDGRRAIIPNADVFTNAVTVNTAFDLRRSEYDVGIGYGDKIPAAREAIMAALREVEGVEQEPAPEVLAWELAGSSVNLKVRWWSHSRRADVVHVQARVIEAIKGALDRAGVDMPFPTQVVLLHDQTEEVDGMRGKQREGWPPRNEGPQPKSMRLVEMSDQDPRPSNLSELSGPPEAPVPPEPGVPTIPPAPGSSFSGPPGPGGTWLAGAAHGWEVQPERRAGLVNPRGVIQEELSRTSAVVDLPVTRVDEIAGVLDAAAKDKPRGQRKFASADPDDNLLRIDEPLSSKDTADRRL